MEKTSRIAVTGINGFVGKHLVRELSENGSLIIGIGREDSLDKEIVDLVDEYFVSDLSLEWPNIEDVDVIIHLAGMASVGPSFNEPQKYINVNSSMITNMCEFYLKNTTKNPRIIIVSSSSLYGSGDNKFDEDSRLELKSPYAVSKALVENQAQYYRNRGLECIIVRPFNHIGPGQMPGFLLPDLYDKIISLEPGASSIAVGDLSTKKDYTDVRDVVRAYNLLALSTELNYETYNICSGRGLSGQDILDSLKKATNNSNLKAVVNKDILRPNEVMVQIGDNSRINSELGWEPKIDINQTIKDFVATKDINSSL